MITRKSDYVSVLQAGRLSRISPQMIRRYCNEGSIRFFRIPSSKKNEHRRVSLRSLRAFLVLHDVPVDLIDVYLQGIK